MKRNENQNEIFAWITNRKKTNEGCKSLVLARIACKYEDTENYKRSKSFNANEMKERIIELKEYIKTLCKRYNISNVELNEYFTRNKYCINF